MAGYIPALSIMQPWSWLIVNRFKKIENRSRRFHYRGPILIHAGLKREADAHEDLMGWVHPVTGYAAKDLGDEYRACHVFETVHRGGIVGIADIVDCVDKSGDDYFVGPFGLILENARPLRFQPCRGMLGLFDPKITVDLSPP